MIIRRKSCRLLLPGLRRFFINTPGSSAIVSQLHGVGGGGEGTCSSRGTEERTAITEPVCRVREWVHSFLLSYYRKGVARRIHAKSIHANTNSNTNGNGSRDTTKNDTSYHLLAKDLMAMPLTSSSDSSIDDKYMYNHKDDALVVKGNLNDGISDKYLGRKMKLLSIGDSDAYTFVSNGHVDGAGNSSLSKYFSETLVDSIVSSSLVCSEDNISSTSCCSSSSCDDHDTHNAVVFMPGHLSALREPGLRMQAVQAAMAKLSSGVRAHVDSSSSSLNNNSGCGSGSHFQPHSSGLLVVIEKINAFKRRSANDLISGWKAALSHIGLQLVEHKYVVNNHYHALVFKKTPENSDDLKVRSAFDDSEFTNKGSHLLWFDSDFEVDGNSNRNVGISVSGDGTDNLLNDSNKSSQFASASSSPLPIAILGAGLGGSALALLLQNSGIPYVVFEKDATFDCRKQGYALTMQQAASTLSALGISEEVARRGVVSYCSESRRSDGSRIGIYGPLVRSGVLLTNDYLKSEKLRRHHRHHDNTRMSISRGSSCTGINSTGPSAGGANEEVVDYDFVKNLLDSFSSERYSRHNLHIPRQELRRIIIDRLDPNKVMWGKTLTGIQETSDGHIELQLLRSDSNSSSISNFRDINDISTFKCNVAVGADGIYSSLRRGLLERSKIKMDDRINDSNISNIHIDESRRSSRSSSGGCASLSNSKYHESGTSRSSESNGLNYLGLMVILGYSPMVEGGGGGDGDVFNLLDQSFRKQIQWVDGVTRVFSMPFDRKHTMWQMSFPVSEADALLLTSKDKKDVKKRALDLVMGWDTHLLTLIERTDVDNLSCHPAYDRSSELITSKTLKLLRGSLSNITFLGDAVHPMSPFKGQGANQALLDALSLSRHIMSSDQVHPSKAPLASALRNYESEMLSRSRLKVARSRDAAVSLHSPSALVEADITRAMAAEKFAAQI